VALFPFARSRPLIKSFGLLITCKQFQESESVTVVEREVYKSVRQILRQGEVVTVLETEYIAYIIGHL
jgi:hypothetical protein